MIRTIRPLERPDPGLERVAKANGFSMHAGVSCEGHQKEKRERLCRYISRPAVAVPRLSLSSTGKVVYTLKTPYRDGTTQVAFDRGGHPPVDFIARLAALVPKPRVNGTGTPGPATMASWHLRGPTEPSLARARHTSETRERRQVELQHRSPHTRRAPCRNDLGSTAKACFDGAAIRIDIEACSFCGGSVRVIVEASNRCIEDQDVMPDKAGHL